MHYLSTDLVVRLFVELVDLPFEADCDFAYNRAEHVRQDACSVVHTGSRDLLQQSKYNYRNSEARHPIGDQQQNGLDHKADSEQRHHSPCLSEVSWRPEEEEQETYYNEKFLLFVADAIS